MAHLLEHCRVVSLQNSEGWTLQGHSKAGERTGFWLQPDKIVVDAGVQTARKPRAVLLTHKHIDHTGALPYILTSRTGMCPVLMPAGAYAPVAKLQHAVRALCGDKVTHTDEEVFALQGCDPRVVAVGDVVRLTKTLEVEVLRAYHDAESVGYGFSRVKRKLKTEYQGLPKSELGALAKRGVQITAEVRDPQLCFFCDSNTRNLSDHDEWKRYPVVVVECTGAGSDSPSPHHTNLTALAPIILSHSKNVQWILVHTSRAFDVAKHGEARLAEMGLPTDRVSFW
jgi:ribonuclease Z